MKIADLMGKIEKLPLILLPLGTECKPEECVEVDVGRVHLSIGKEWVPFIGPALHLSFSGPLSESNQIISDFCKQLGLPTCTDTVTEIGHYFWQIVTDEIPRATACRLLGEERIKQIYQDLGLSESEKRILSNILAFHEMFGEIEPRMAYTLIMVADQPLERQLAISRALKQIAQESNQKLILESVYQSDN